MHSQIQHAFTPTTETPPYAPRRLNCYAVVAAVVVAGAIVLTLSNVTLAAEKSPGSGNGRIAKGLVAGYHFDSGDGKVIRDTSGYAKPLDLEIRTPKTVKRINGGIRIIGKPDIRSPKAAAKITDAVKRSRELTLEAWVTPENLTQEGPARLLTISGDSSNRNVTLGQQANAFDVRMRSTGTSENGIPSIASKSGTVSTKLTHVAYCRDRSGNARLFINGELAKSGRVAGSLSNWNPNYALLIGDEVRGGRTWKGDLHLVAIYSRALLAREVQQNFAAGADAAFRTKPDLPKLTKSQSLFRDHVAPIFAHHCAECHDSATHEGGLDMTKRDAFVAGGESGSPIDGVDVQHSELWNQIAIDEMPKDRDPLSPEQKQWVRSWIESGAEWSAESYDPSELIMDMTPPENYVRRLTVSEYIRTVKTAVGVDIATEARDVLPAELRADGFRNTSYNLNVGLKHIEAFADLAGTIVERMDVAKFARRFSKQRLLTDNNMKPLIGDMGQWLLRGPLSAQEVTLYRGISTTVASAGGDFDEAIGFVVRAMLQSPRFLYRIENQRGDGEAWPVDDFELASRLSYTIWGSAPDEALYNDAKAGRLTPESIEQHVSRMLKDPRAIEKSVEFITEWLDLERLSNLRPNAKRFPKWQPELADDMRRETIEFFREIAWTSNQPLSSLLNADVTFLTPQLARHYGLKPRGDKLTKYDLTKVSARGGLLTQGSLLTIGGDDASMVTRGLFVLTDLLYSEVGDPPPGLDTTPVPTSPGRTHRAIATERVESTSCGGCHRRFEPLAYGLEKFDGLGTYHESDEHGNKLREDGQVLFPGDAAPTAYKTSGELMQLLAGSDRVKRSITRKIIQFSIGRPLGGADLTQVAAIHDEAVANGHTYAAVIRAIAMSDLVQATITEAE